MGTELITRRDILEARLDDGWNRIDVAIKQGKDVRAWEDFWIDLLHQYEAVCDRLGAHHEGANTPTP